MSNATRAGRLILAEDDEAMRELLSSLLRLDGHEVVVAADGLELLASLRAGPPPDLILSDVRMPGLNGLSMLSKIREAGLAVPVILISAFADEEAHRRAAELGATLLDKPLQMEDLRATVRAFMR